jgi:hypothetical protein
MRWICFMAIAAFTVARFDECNTSISGVATDIESVELLQGCAWRSAKCLLAIVALHSHN